MAAAQAAYGFIMPLRNFSDLLFCVLELRFGNCSSGDFGLSAFVEAVKQQSYLIIITVFLSDFKRDIKVININFL